MNLPDQDLEIARLSGSQRAALGRVAELIDRRMTGVSNDLAIILRRAGCTRSMFEEAMRSLGMHACPYCPLDKDNRAILNFMSSWASGRRCDFAGDWGGLQLAPTGT